MDWIEASEWTAAAAVIAALFLFPKWFSLRGRILVGLISFVLATIAILGGVTLGDQPFMQSEFVALIWVGGSILAMVLAITLLVPVFFEWLWKHRKPRRRRERWSAGHQD